MKREGKESLEREETSIDVSIKKRKKIGSRKAFVLSTTLPI